MSPSDLLVRWAGPADAQAIAEIHVLAWQTAYRGLLPDELLDAMTAANRLPRWQQWLAEPAPRTRVAEQDGQVLGWLTTGPQRDRDLDPATVAEIYALYVHPAAWGHGCGSALMASVLADLAARGYAETNLWVLHNNARAIRFYEQQGFRADGAAKSETGAYGAVFDEIRYRRALGPVTGKR